MTLPAASQDGFSVFQAMLIVHVSGGGVGLVAGFLAVAAPKGGVLHRRAGTVFVVAMMTMAAFGLALATYRGQSLNMLAAAFTLYLVASAWLTVRRRRAQAGWAELLGCFYALGVAAFAAAVAAGAGASEPEPAGLVFGGLAALAAVLDVRVILRRGVAGVSRLSRHLWRMCAALFVASGSFFLGQMDEIPAALSGPHLFVLAFAPLGALGFWLVRVRFTRPAKSVPVAL
jgi:uncharacterized membrane protein